MGEARKRRLPLIRGGKATEAKGAYVAPERLTNLTIQMPTPKANLAHEIYATKVDKATCPTPGSFFLAVFEAGMMEFEKFYAQENAPKPPAPSDIEVDPATDQPAPEGML